MITTGTLASELWQVVSADGNIHWCGKTKSAAKRYATRVSNTPTNKAELTVQKVTPGYCPIRRHDHAGDDLVRPKYFSYDLVNIATEEIEATELHTSDEIARLNHILRTNGEPQRWIATLWVNH